MKKILSLLILILFLVTSISAATWYFWRYRTHTTDCTSITDGRAGDLCYEEDDKVLYVCDTADGLCNSASEWKRLSLSNSSVLINDLCCNLGNFSVRPMLVIVYDDAVRATWTKAYPIHQEKGVPAVAAININGMEGPSGILPHQLREMQDAGWEIASHGLNHLAFYSTDLTQDANTGDTKLYIEYLSPIKVGYVYRVWDDNAGPENVTVTGTGSDDNGNYVTIENGLANSYQVSDGAVLKIHEDYAYKELYESKRILSEMDLRIGAFVYPYNSENPEARVWVSHFYRAACKGGDGRVSFPIGTDELYALPRKSFETDKLSDSELQNFLDTIATNNELGLLYGHANLSTLTEERIANTIDWARERGIKVVTLREALVHFATRRKLRSIEVNGVIGSSPDEVTVTDSGDANPASYTLTPSTSSVKLICNDADGCDIIMGEADVIDGTVVTIVNVSANVCNFSDTAGVSELAGDFVMGQNDTLSLVYVEDRWVEIGRSNN